MPSDDVSMISRRSDRESSAIFWKCCSPPQFQFSRRAGTRELNFAPTVVCAMNSSKNSRSISSASVTGPESSDAQLLRARQFQNRPSSCKTNSPEISDWTHPCYHLRSLAKAQGAMQYAYMQKCTVLTSTSERTVYEILPKESRDPAIGEIPDFRPSETVS
jgi:hypothetical protein